MLGKQALLPKWIVLKNDPAIDLYQSDYTNYILSLFDESYLTFVKDKVPTKFLINQLTFIQQNLISTQVSIRDKILLTIRYSLSGISNYLIEIEKEDMSGLINTVITKDTDLGKIIDEKWLGEMRFNSDLLIELSLLILYFSDSSLFNNLNYTYIIREQANKVFFTNKDIDRIYSISLL